MEVWKEYSLTIVIVEHRMPFVLGLSEHVQVLDHGVTMAEGPPNQSKTNPNVISGLLGREAGDRLLEVKGIYATTV